MEKILDLLREWMNEGEQDGNAGKKNNPGKGATSNDRYYPSSS